MNKQDKESVDKIRDIINREVGKAVAARQTKAPFVPTVGNITEAIAAMMEKGKHPLSMEQRALLLGALAVFIPAAAKYVVDDSIRKAQHDLRMRGL